jgi:S1-C subfamily serine protease
VVTCAHVVQHEGATLSKLLVDGQPATLIRAFPALDLAFLQTPDTDVAVIGDSQALQVADELIFGGFPSGVRTPSVFGGIVSAIGDRLIQTPSCRLIQVNGMINLGNSGGPVLSADTGKVVGIVTAKNVPLLREIDHLRAILRSIPQFPSEVAIGTIDFSKFVNLVMQALLSVSSSLRLVQVGVGYAVPVDLFPEV